MFFTRYKHILITVVLLAFTSQSMAVQFMSCQSDTEVSVTSMSSEMHAEHTMPKPDSHTMESDCCDSGCECVFGVCASPVLLSSQTEVYHSSANLYVRPTESHLFDSLAFSIYKPPISR